jgi:hypothetical protein
MPDDELLDVLAHLTSQQLSAFALLLDQDGQGCGLSTQMCSSLVQRGLLSKVLDQLTQGTRLCEQGCGHAWYDIPQTVRDAYTQFGALPADTGDPGPRADGPDPAVEHPATVALAVAERRTPVRQVTPQYWARILDPLTGVLNLYGTTYERGQLLTLRGDWGDERLERLGFVEKAPPDKAYLHAQCGVCGAWFVSEMFRDAHGRVRHRQRFDGEERFDIEPGMAGPEGGAALRDVTGDAESRRQWTEYPPYLEKSKASQQA